MTSPDPPPGDAPTAESPLPRPTVVLGVLGGIASGKSRVARALAGAEGRVIDADELAEEVLGLPEVVERIRERFGEGCLDREGRPDRDALAGLVFDPETGDEARRALEGWTHPLVRARILERLREARAAGIPRVVLDVPLLLENDSRHGLVKQCDVLVFVDADLPARDRRARHARGWSPGEVARREATQLELDLKRKRADVVVSNNGSPEELEQEVSQALRRLGIA